MSLPYARMYLHGRVQCQLIGFNGLTVSLSLEQNLSIIYNIIITIVRYTYYALRQQPLSRVPTTTRDDDDYDDNNNNNNNIIYIAFIIYIIIMIRERSVRSRFSSRVLLILTYNVGTYIYLKINRPPIDSRVAANAAQSSRVHQLQLHSAVSSYTIIINAL